MRLGYEQFTGTFRINHPLLSFIIVYFVHSYTIVFLQLTVLYSFFFVNIYIILEVSILHPLYQNFSFFLCG
ncbi:hypothetical protein C2G38_2066670, partial [Gigaspora rosea]